MEETDQRHAPQYLNNGIGSDHQLMAWLGTVTFPTEQDFEDVAYARMVYKEVVKRSLRAGVSQPIPTIPSVLML